MLTKFDGVSVMLFLLYIKIRKVINILYL